MLKRSLLLLAVILVFTPFIPVASAQNVDLKAALERMNSIIAEMEKLRAEFAALSTTVEAQSGTPAVLGVQNSAVFTESLEYGETNNDIKRIQKLLATDPAIYPYGVASGFFGPKTEEALKNLQARNGWETPGVVGPATRALLEDYFRAYPNENWPADVLSSKPPVPQVQGVSVSTTQNNTTVNPNYSAGSAVASGANLAKEINVTFDPPEALIEIIYTSGNRKGLIADTTNKDEVVAFIAGRTVLTEAMVRAVIDYSGSSSSGGSGSDKSDAEDAIDDADRAIDDADDEIEEADEDGEDIDWAEDTLRDAKRKLDDAEDAFVEKDYEDAIELAEEAEELAKDAEDRIGEEKGSGSDDIDEINVDVGDGESRVKVEYENGDDRKFDVDEDDEDDIIEAIAKKLDLDEDEVEDLIDFDYGDIDRIEVRVDDDSALVRVFYESGYEQRLRPNETDEDEIIEYIAKKLDLDEDEVEGVIDFD